MKGVTTLPPQADVVELMRDLKAEPVIVNWDRLAKIAGGLMEKTEFYPERYLVREFLGEGQLRELGKAR